MTGKQSKIGDIVAWADVPSGAMVRWRWDGHGDEFYWKRHRFVASRVGTHDGRWRGPGDDNGSFAPHEPVTIIALDVPADATADQLRELVEVFEVREAIAAGVAHTTPGMQHVCIRYFDDDATRMAGRLHAAGWRPGMTAEDAARLLAEVTQ